MQNWNLFDGIQNIYIYKGAEAGMCAQCLRCQFEVEHWDDRIRIFRG